MPYYLYPWQLEHIHNVDELFNYIRNSLHNKGFMIIAVPNHSSIDRFIFKDDWSGYDFPRHLYHFTPDVMGKLLKKYNFNILKTHRMLQDTFYNVFCSLKKYKFLKYFLFPLHIFVCLLVILFNKDKSSTLVYICQKK